jgi:hypothetical protein
MLRVGFLDPMFDNRVSLLGLPADLLVLLVAVAGSIVGLLWLRRLLTIEPEVETFRATSARGGRGRVLVAVGLIMVAALLAVGLAGIRQG